MDNVARPGWATSPPTANITPTSPIANMRLKAAGPPLTPLASPLLVPREQYLEPFVEQCSESLFWAGYQVG
jgi:hypothetical protein